jgi:DNA invertase Pin-like site-specific DNA recombinase
MNLIGYIRVSTEEQARDGVSLGQQQRRLLAYCDLHEHTLVGIYGDDGVSASVPLAKRAAGKQLLGELKAGGAEGVVVVRLDRLFRDALDGLTFFRAAERSGATVHSISELIDSSTPAGKLGLTIQLAAAQYERDLAVQRATECNHALREQGKVYGHVPYGCVAVGEGEARRLMRNPITWQVRDTAVAALQDGMSLRSLADEMAGQHIASPTGKRRWSPNTLRELRTHHASLQKLPMAELATVALAVHEAEIS